MRTRDFSRTIAGRLLFDARRRAGLTQDELARRVGVARPLITQYETGRKDPSLTTLSRLIAACGMELRMSADPLSPADLAQYALDARIGPELGRRNAERARREVVALRHPTAAELAELRG